MKKKRDEGPAFSLKKPQTQKNGQTLRPLLKWAGGKRWLAPLLKELWQPYQQLKLVEPFTGGMAVALALNPKSALLNDANSHLINFYQQVRKGLVIKNLFKNNANFYYELRAVFNDLIHHKNYKTKKAAEIFYFLMKTGFNGLCRFNHQGEFNVPFGSHKSIKYKKDFLDYQTILKPWDFKQGDFQKISLEGNEFIYADPPYDVEFTQYHSKDFIWQDQIRLAEWLAKHSGPVIASNQATERILELYRDLKFSVVTLPAPRSIACNGDRRPAIEMLALKGIPRRLVQRVKRL